MHQASEISFISKAKKLDLCMESEFKALVIRLEFLLSFKLHLFLGVARRVCHGAMSEDGQGTSTGITSLLPLGLSGMAPFPFEHLTEPDF